MLKYYIGKDKEVVSFSNDVFTIKNGDKLDVEFTYDNSIRYCNHEYGTIILTQLEIGSLLELRQQKIKYIEKYYY